jgi:acetylornithine aminotransferase
MDLTLVRGEGSYVYDTNGTQYLDLYGGHAVISIGHGNLHWKNRIHQVLDGLSFYSNSVHLPIQEEYAAALAKYAKLPDYKVFFCNSGAEANENAMKLASFANGKSGVLAFTGAFHGRTSLSVKVTDNDQIQAPINQALVFSHPFNQVSGLRALFETNHNEISCAIVEGIQGVAGIHVASNAFLRELRSLCTEFNVVLIGDSVQCGAGRTGTYFSHQQSGIEADIYTMAKGIGNGFPIGALLCAPHLPEVHGMLGTTFGGNPMACAAGLAVIEECVSKDLPKNAIEVGSYLMDSLRAIPYVTTVRGKGLMIGFEVAFTHQDLRQRLAQKHQILTGTAKGNVIRLLPSLSLTRAEASLFINALKSEII